jgi:CHAT domain-containing protein
MRTILWCVLLLSAWPAVPKQSADLVGERGRALQQFSSAQNHFLRGENKQALETYEKARELFLAAGDQIGQGQARQGEADVLFRLGDDHGALDAYQGARELFLAAGDQLGQGDTWRGEAKVLSRLDEDQKAREACETARQLLRSAREHLATGERLRLGHTWYGEAEILYRLGETDSQARYGYQRARQLYVAAGDKLGEGNTWRGEANVLLRLGQSETALDAYKKARELFRALGDREGQGDTWFGEAQAWMSITVYPATRDLDTGARPDRARKAKKPATNPALHLGKAKKAAGAAIAEYKGAGVVSMQITALLFKAEVEAAAEEAAARGQMSQMALPVANLGPFTLKISLPAEFFKKLRKPNTRSSEEAIGLQEQWRGTATTDADRTTREKVIREAYDLLVPLRAERGKAAEALQLAESARARVLLDLLAAPPSSGAMSSSAELAARKTFPQERPLDTAAIQNLAREAGPLLVYYVAESETWGFLILPEAAEIYLRPIKVSRSELEKRIRDFYHDLANSGAEARAWGLWSLLIDPFIERLPKSGSLVLIPHGPLHELPFEALHDAEGKRLFERWRISVTPSVSALAIARSRHAAPLPDDFFVGFFSGRGLDLPREEVEKISGFFDSSQAAEANYQNYESLAAHARHLLISTRGVQSEGSRTSTYLEIEPTADHENRLTAAEIAAIPLKAELVTLAACDTSSGQAPLSDERINVTRSFLIAGAAAVLATRWKLPEDAATSQFLADFYQAYRKDGMRKDEALTEARRLSRERGDPAQVWAGWVLIGDAR